MTTTLKIVTPSKDMETLVHVYGADLPKEQEGKAFDILRASHRYRNQLVEIELERRKQVNAIIAKLDPALGALVEKHDAMQAAYDDMDECKARYLLKKEKDALWNEKIKKPRQALFTTDQFKQLDIPVKAAHKAATHKARAECGLYSGQYSVVEGSCKKIGKGSPPRFRPFGGEGRVGVYIQGGVNVTNFLQLDPPDREGGKWRNARIRIGSSGAGGRTVIWMPFRLSLHRPLPEGAKITWAWLKASRVAWRTKWELQVVFSIPNQVDERNSRQGTVAIDVGWRRRPDGGLRCAYWYGSDGATGEIMIPAGRMMRRQKVDDLLSIRDDHFNRAKPILCEWVKTAGEILPEWFKERTKTLSHWKSKLALTALIWHWKKNRFAGDETIFPTMDEWRAKEKHLYDWQENQRQGELRWRLNYYRNQAAMLATRYQCAVIENVDWSVFQKMEPKQVKRKSKVKPHPAAPDDMDDPKAKLLKKMQNWAGVSYLNGALKNRFTEVAKVPPEYSTLQCHECLERCSFDAAENLMHTCEHCKVTWDQDYNAARNILRVHLQGPAKVAVGG